MKHPHPLEYAVIPNAVRNLVHYAKLRNLSYSTAFILMVLATFAISSCKEKNAPEADPNTLPMALFYIDDPVYRRIDSLDGNTYAFVTAHNNSAYSNRWQWSRPGIRTEFTGFGPVEFMTDKDDAVTQVYLATALEQRFYITLIAYSDVAIGMNPDSTIMYKTFESHPFTQEVRVKKPD